MALLRGGAEPALRAAQAFLVFLQPKAGLRELTLPCFAKGKHANLALLVENRTSSSPSTRNSHVKTLLTGWQPAGRASLFLEFGNDLVTGTYQLCCCERDAWVRRPLRLEGGKTDSIAPLHQRLALVCGILKDGMNDFSTEALTACGSGKIGVRYGRRDVRFLLAAFRPDSGLMAGRKELSHLLPYSSLEKRTGACEAYACAGGYTAASLRHWTPPDKTNNARRSCRYICNRKRVSEA